MAPRDIFILVVSILVLVGSVRVLKTYIADGRVSFSLRPAYLGIKSSGKRFFGDMTVWWDGARARRVNKRERRAL